MYKNIYLSAALPAALYTTFSYVTYYFFFFSIYIANAKERLLYHVGIT